MLLQCGRMLVLEIGGAKIGVGDGAASCELKAPFAPSGPAPRERSGTGESSKELFLADRGGGRKNPPSDFQRADLDRCLRIRHVICMTRDPRSTRPWRDYLSATERQRLTFLEKQIKRQGADLAKLRAERNAIQNRASRRAGQPEDKP